MFSAIYNTALSTLSNKWPYEVQDLDPRTQRIVKVALTAIAGISLIALRYYPAEVVIPTASVVSLTTYIAPFFLGKTPYEIAWDRPAVAKQQVLSLAANCKSEKQIQRFLTFLIMHDEKVRYIGCPEGPGLFEFIGTVVATAFSAFLRYEFQLTRDDFVLSVTDLPLLEGHGMISAFLNIYAQCISIDRKLTAEDRARLSLCGSNLPQAIKDKITTLHFVHFPAYQFTESPKPFGTKMRLLELLPQESDVQFLLDLFPQAKKACISKSVRCSMLEESGRVYPKVVSNRGFDIPFLSNLIDRLKTKGFRDIALVCNVFGKPDNLLSEFSQSEGIEAFTAATVLFRKINTLENIEPATRFRFSPGEARSTFGFSRNPFDIPEPFDTLTNVIKSKTPPHLEVIRGEESETDNLLGLGIRGILVSGGWNTLSFKTVDNALDPT